MTQPVPSTARKRPPWRRVVIAIALLLTASLAGVALLRETLATRLALGLLQDEGVPVQSLEVTELTPDAVSLAGLSLGESGEVTAKTLKLRLAWEGLTPRPVEVTLDGLTVTLDLTGEGPLLGSLQPVVERYTATRSSAESDSAETAAAPLPPLPRITLSEAVVTAATPSGPMTGSLTGGVAPQDDGSLSATATLDFDNALGRLRASLEGSYQPDGTWQAEGKVSEGQLAWQDFALGGFDGDLQVAFDPGAGPAVKAQFDLSDLAYTPAESPPLRLAEGRLTLDTEIGGDNGATRLELVLRGDGETLSLAGQARAQPAGETLNVEFTLRGDAATSGGLAQTLPALLPGLQIQAGELVAEASGTGVLGSGGRRPESWQALVEALPESHLEMSSEVIFSQVHLADGTEGVSGHLPLAVQADQNSLTLTLTQDAELRVERPSRQALQELGLPADALPLLASGLSLTLSAQGDLPFKSVSAPLWPPRDLALAITAQGRSDQGLSLLAEIDGEARLDDALALAAFSGQVDGRLDLASLVLGGREGQGILAELPLAVRYGPEGLGLALSRPGALRLRQFGSGAPLRLQAPLAFALNKLSLQAAPDGASYQYELEAEEDGAAATIARAEADPLEISVGPAQASFDGRFAQDRGHNAQLDLWLTDLDLPTYDVGAEAAEISVTLDAELRPAASRFTLGPVALQGDDAPLAPMTLTGQLQRKGAGYDIAGILGLSGGRAVADVTARYEDSGGVKMEAVSRLIAFSPEGLQPADLSPLLSGLEEVNGNLTGKAVYAWPPDPTAESGRVTLANLSFESPAGQVRGLDLDLVLTRLLPLTSAAGQKLSIASLDAALPVDNIELLFALDQAPRPQLDIARGGFDLAGARWQIEPLLVDPAAARHRIVLATEQLDLAAFFDLIEVDGLSGKGTLKGRIPIVFDGGDVIVEDGRFEALGPGVLNIRIDALRTALSGSGETVEMAARALEDFHFENLSLDLQKTAENDATLRLSTLGNNPAVLNGQPFQFNINLESNLTSVLDALKQGYSLSDDALRRAWQVRE